MQQHTATVALVLSLDVLRRELAIERLGYRALELLEHAPDDEEAAARVLQQIRDDLAGVDDAETSKYLTSYLIYNDGIQTVIAVSSTFAAAPLLRGGLELSKNTLIQVILVIQFVAFLGALFWGKLAKWIGGKRAIIVSLVIWAGVVIYAYSGMKGESRGTEFFILGVIIAIVLGGSQAISRSLFAQMIPKSKEAEFFSIYEISERGTSWLGPMIFGIANQVFGNLRIAILALIFFSVVGLILLPFVNDKKAIEDVRKFDTANS